MVKGIDRFKEYFSDFTDQYVLIGGAACDISFESNNVDFRATRDLDIVLIVEALTREFGYCFWSFVRDGGYQNRAKSSGASQFYRFDKPTKEGFPFMIELFARTGYILESGSELTPIIFLGQSLCGVKQTDISKCRWDCWKQFKQKLPKVE